MFLYFIDIFPLFMNFFPIFFFNCKFQLFLHNFMQISEKFPRFAPFAVFFAHFCVRNGKISDALHYLKDAMKIFTDVGKKK